MIGRRGFLGGLLSLPFAVKALGQAHPEEVTDPIQQQYEAALRMWQDKQLGPSPNGLRGLVDDGTIIHIKLPERHR